MSCLMKCRLIWIATNALSTRQLVACQPQLELAKVKVFIVKFSQERKEVNNLLVNNIFFALI